MDVVLQGDRALVMVPVEGSSRSDTGDTLAAGLQIRWLLGMRIRENVNASTVVPAIDAADEGAEVSGAKGQEPQLFVPGWSHVFANSCMKNPE